VADDGGEADITPKAGPRRALEKEVEEGERGWKTRSKVEQGAVLEGKQKAKRIGKIPELAME
jgi:hypothetical protein